ncbi:hypothetical protein LCGC14_2882530, partial [marine sediment metagenome]
MMKLKMNKKWRISIIVMTAILVVSMVPNTTVMISNDAVQTESPTMSIGPPYKAALMLGGDETDLGFSYVAIQGMYALEANYGWSISISRHVSEADHYRVMNNYGYAGYDVVFIVGGEFIGTSYFSGVVETHN